MVVGQHQHVRARAAARRAPARAAPAPGATCTAATASSSGASASGATGARAGSRPGAGRGRAGPGSGPARARRGRRRRSRRTGRRRSGSSSTVTSPPQHCTPCWNGALSDRCAVNDSGATAPEEMRSRARRTASSSRLPPPIDAHVADGADDHLGAGLPRARARARRSPSPARPARARRAARRPPRTRSSSRHHRRRSGGAGRGQRPVDRLGRRRRGELDDDARAAPNAAHASRSASRTLNASISGGSPTAFEP